MSYLPGSGALLQIPPILPHLVHLQRKKTGRTAKQHIRHFRIELNPVSGKMEEQIFYTRKIPLQSASFHQNSRSVRVIAATETPLRFFNPLQMKWEYIIHLVSGLVLPPSGQVPLLDTHDRTSVSSVIGSARNFRVAGKNLECDVFFSETQGGKEAAQKVREGHLTDFSVGYIILEAHRIPKGESKEINGRIFRGPIQINSRWRLIELSVAAVGRDENAKVIPAKTAGAVNEKDEKPEKSGIGIIDIAFFIFLAMMLMGWIYGIF